MGKGFTIEGVEGYDLAALFAEAFQRKVNNINVLSNSLDFKKKVYS